MKRILLAVALMAAPSALAQQAAQQSPMEQALSQRLSAEIGSNLQAAATVIDLQRQLAAAHTKIKELDPEQKPSRGGPPPAEQGK